jgi:hypothetical protein
MDRGIGWILFAWLMLLVAGVMSLIDGIVALSQSSFFHDYGAHYVASNLTTWGWVALIIGVVEIIAAVSVWRGGSFGRWFGILVAAISLILTLFWIPIVPFWALMIMLIDVLVIYGLAVYGGQHERVSD